MQKGKMSRIKALFKSNEPNDVLMGIQPIQTQHDKLLRQVADFDNLEAAFQWLATNSQEHHHNNSVWDFRRQWPTIKDHLSEQLCRGEYQYERGASKERVGVYLKRWLVWATMVVGSFFLAGCYYSAASISAFENPYNAYLRNEIGVFLKTEDSGCPAGRGTCDVCFQVKRVDYVLDGVTTTLAPPLEGQHMENFTLPVGATDVVMMIIPLTVNGEPYDVVTNDPNSGVVVIVKHYYSHLYFGEPFFMKLTEPVKRGLYSMGPRRGASINVSFLGGAEGQPEMVLKQLKSIFWVLPSKPKS